MQPRGVRPDCPTRPLAPGAVVGIRGALRRETLVRSTCGHAPDVVHVNSSGVAHYPLQLTTRERPPAEDLKGVHPEVFVLVAQKRFHARSPLVRQWHVRQRRQCSDWSRPPPSNQRLMIDQYPACIGPGQQQTEIAMVSVSPRPQTFEVLWGKLSIAPGKSICFDFEPQDAFVALRSNIGMARGVDFDHVGAKSKQYVCC